MRVGVTQIRFIGEGSFFRASSGIFLKAAWALYSSEKGSTIAGDLQASEIAKTIILVVNGKADVTVLFQSDELSPAFREHPELAVIFMLPNNWRYLRGDIYYADMEPHIGSEQGGKRPVVVLQNNIGNRHSPTLIVATVTTRTEKKKKQPTHVLVDSNPAFEEPSMILLEQIFTIDKSRIKRFMGYASKAEMLRIDMALLVSLALNVLSGNRSE